MTYKSHSKNDGHWNKFLAVGYDWEDLEKKEEIIQGYYSLFYQYAPRTKHIIEGKEFYSHDKDDLSLLKGAFNSALTKYFNEH